MNVSFVAVPINDNPVVLLTCDKLVSMVLSYYKTCVDVCTVKPIHHSRCLNSAILSLLMKAALSMFIDFEITPFVFMHLLAWFPRI